MTIADLDLVAVYCDCDLNLVSLTIGEVLAHNIRPLPGTPYFNMDEECGQYTFGDEICIAAGRDPSDGFPGWDVVTAWLKANRHLLK